MKKITIFTLLGLLLMASCTNDDSFDGSNTGVGRTGIRFRLKESGYAGDHGARVGSVSTGDYDKVFFHIADAEGDIVTAVRAAYDASTSEIYAEGLHEGDYTLVVLAIKGDETGDRITVNDISNIREEWLAFPPNLHKPLEAEYFYSLTPFEVRRTTSGDGEYISIDQDIVQDRIVGRMDFNFVYSNRYVENAVTERRIRLSEPRFRTSLNGDGTLGGISDGMMDDILAGENHSYLFMPIVEGTQVEGVFLLTFIILAFVPIENPHSASDGGHAESYTYRGGSGEASGRYVSADVYHKGCIRQRRTFHNIERFGKERSLYRQDSAFFHHVGPSPAFCG